MWKRRLFLLAIIAAMMLACVFDVETILPADAPVKLTEENKYIALTFDDGPRRGTTDLLLDGLRERGASATFFLVGEQIQGNEDLVMRMKNEGHQAGNHTWSHMRLEGISRNEILHEVERTEELLERLLGEYDSWLRPPYGSVSADSEDLIRIPMIKWSVDPRDWESRDKEKIVQAVLQDAKPNSIVLLHDIYPASVKAALEIVDTLQKQGYEFVTVRELFALNSIVPEAGKMYRSG